MSHESLSLLSSREDAGRGGGNIARHSYCGNVGIQGVWPGGDAMIQLGIGWIDACIALKNKDIEELFSMVPVGTKVTIRK